MSQAQATALLEVKSLSKTFDVRTGLLRRAQLQAVNSVDLILNRGRTVAVVGESGSGKTTLGRLVVRLIEPTSGSIMLDGVDLATLTGRSLREARPKMQIVFQDPYESLSPWQTVGQTLREPLELHGGRSSEPADKTVAAILERVGLSPAHAHRYPHQLSGGQQQRVGIARAVITNPDLVVLDEPTSSLDVSVQAQILRLLKSLQEERAISYIFITHDLSVAHYLAHDILVMYMGAIVEQGPVDQVFDDPKHPYTRALLGASPRVSPRAHAADPLRGEQPSPLNLPPGCPLFSRCPIALPACESAPQRLTETSHSHLVACWRVAPPADGSGAPPGGVPSTSPPVRSESAGVRDRNDNPQEPPLSGQPE